MRLELKLCMNNPCPDCGRPLPEHGKECPAQPYPSLQIEDQVESDPRERYEKRRELWDFISGAGIALDGAGKG